jgi:hypothetical protein
MRSSTVFLAKARLATGSARAELAALAPQEPLTWGGHLALLPLRVAASML